jgi:ABC-2 type transport system ATP-binding protein
MQSQPEVIDARHVELTFGGGAGVHNLTLQVPAGTIFGLIGPSGSGKTTSVRLLTGILTPQQGELRVLGAQPSRFRARVRERIGYMPQLFTLYPNLTVWENLSFVASLYGLGYVRRRARMTELLAFVELDDARNRLGSRLSGGMQRRLSLACSLVHDPELLFADEPTAGIDPVLRGKFWEYFRALRDAGHTLFVTTQYVGEAAYCDLVGVMRDGRLIHMDTPDGLRRTALGGEVIKLVVGAGQTHEAARRLMALDPVNEVRRSRSQAELLYIYCDDAGETLPLIFPALASDSGITVTSAEQFMPPFDDIFITLMERAEDHHA